MKMLGVAEYDHIERLAGSKMPAHLTSNFNPSSFPLRVAHEGELVQCVEVFDEQACQQFFSQVLSAISTDEFDLLQRLIGCLCDFTEEWFHKLLLARMSSLQSLNIQRHIKYLFGANKPRVFEIMPGPGYLSALLSFENAGYASSDPRQPFYIYQNHFMNFTSNGKLCDCVLYDFENVLFNSFGASSFVHLPWWDFPKLSSLQRSCFDVIVCGHSFYSLPLAQVQSILSIARSMLKDNQDALKVVIFNGWGETDPVKRASIIECFYETGFVTAHNDHRITVLAPNETKIAVGGRPYPSIDEYQSDTNPLSNTIVQNRERDRELYFIEYDQLDTLFTILLGASEFQKSEMQQGATLNHVI